MNPSGYSVTSGTNNALRIYGNLSLLEMAPVLFAVDRIHAGPCVVEHGGAMALWGKTSDLASLNSAGQADIAANSETQTLRAAFAHPDLRVIFTIAECPYRIVARRSAGIACIADLRGKRVGTQIESSAAYFLDCMLRTAGLTAADVISVPFMAHTDTPVSLLPQALRKGELDAVALWEPQMQRALVAIGDDAVVFSDAGVYTEKFNLSTTQANLDNPAMRPRIVEFVRDLTIAAQRMKAESEAACQLVARAAELDIETVRGAWPRFAFAGGLAADLIDVFVRQEVWIAEVEHRSPRNRDALAKLIDGSVLREALAVQ